MSGQPQRRGRSRWRRLAPIAGAALLAFGVGAVLGARHVPSSQRVAERFAAAWQRGDLAGMYALTDAGAQKRSLKMFAGAYRQAEATATASQVRFGAARGTGDSTFAIPAAVTTVAFGTVRAVLAVPVGDVDGQPRVHWTPALAFPGLHAGEALTRRTALPQRAALLARDRTPMIRGRAGTTVTPVAASIVGDLGAVPADREAALYAEGVPQDAQIGVSGLERVFDERLRGQAGGVLLAGARTLASRPPQASDAVRTTISLKVQAAAVSALAGRLGGVVSLRPGTGEILAAAGIPLSGLQPPGSTFKIITATAGLEAKATTLSTSYPIETEATLEGVPLENANGEYCGGTLVQSFAKSCNSVFAPLGVKVGAERLVEMARRFGFDQDTGIPGAATPTLPSAGEIGDDLAVGSSAIGQGRVQATALTMTLVGATIALGGERPRPTFAYGQRLGRVRVTSPKVAKEVATMMQAVVAYGTGVAAAIPGTTVAGKTGTAELEDTRKPDDTDPAVPLTPEQVAAEQVPDTDAWFVGYAPARRKVPRAVVGVLLVRAGAGGDVAAPVARQVLQASL